MKNKYRTSRKDGLTLVEIMIAMGLLSLLSIGILNGTLQARKLTEETIYHSAAINGTIGYLEQIKSIPYQDLQLSIANPSGIPVETVIDYQTPDPLYLNVWNSKTMTINTDPDGNAIETMDFWVLPTIEDLSPPTTAGAPALAIRISYAWKSPANNRIRYGNEKIIRSSVVTY